MKIGAIFITDAPQRRKLRNQLPQAADERADRQADERTRAEMRIEPPAERDAADDRAEIEKARGHRRRAENMLRVEHSHHERRERHEQDERPHDPREQNRQRGFFRRPAPPRHHIDQLRREDDPEQRDRAHENGGQRCDFVREPPGGVIAFGCDLF